MESAQHSLSRRDCNNAADVPSFTLRTGLSAIPFVSDLCGVDVQWFQQRSSQDFAEFQGILSVNDFWLPRRLQELHQALLGLSRNFLFYTGRIGQILYHHDVSMIVTRFTFFTENFVIRCDQVTKTFRSGHDCTSTSFCNEPSFFFVFKQISQFGSFGKCV